MDIVSSDLYENIQIDLVLLSCMQQKRYQSERQTQNEKRVVLQQFCILLTLRIAPYFAVYTGCTILAHIFLAERTL